MLELVKVDDNGGAHVFVTFKMPRKLVGYISSILDDLLGVARQLHWRARCAAADRKAMNRIHQINGSEKEIIQIREEMIYYLRSELNWPAQTIADVYQLTPGNVRQILHRRKQKQG